MNNDYQRWYVESAYEPATGSKMEHALMGYVRKYFIDCLVYEKDIDDVVSNVNAAQERFYESNKRLRKVAIYKQAPFAYSLTGNERRTTMLIRIGVMSITLRKIREEIETVDPEFPNAYDFDLSKGGKA